MTSLAPAMVGCKIATEANNSRALSTCVTVVSLLNGDIHSISGVRYVRPIYTEPLCSNQIKGSWMSAGKVEQNH